MMAFSLCILVQSRLSAVRPGFQPSVLVLVRPIFRHGLKPAPTWLKAFGRNPLRRLVVEPLPFVNVRPPLVLTKCLDCGK